LLDPIGTAFEETFGAAPELSASAPGRVNLLGEHTDYNEGFVLPTVLPQKVTVALRARPDREVHAASAQFGESAFFVLGEEAADRSWRDYVKGVTQGLAAHGLAIQGFEAFFVSEVPVGAGLSSSAALSVALLRGLRELFDLPLEDVTLAKIAQWGENNVVGVPVGLLDPMACHLGREGTALFLDTRALAFERLPWPADIELVVLDSGVTHQHSTGAYRQRRHECEEAARLLGVSALRDVVEGDERILALPAPLDRRVRHVVSENARVLRAVDALEAGDAAPLGALFNSSHRSLRDDFEASDREVDALVERAWKDEDVLGARLTGGGFGGAVVMLVKQGAALAVGHRLAGGKIRLLSPRDPEVT